MKCKKCKREIQKDFNLCPYCGYRIVPDATEIKVPEPKRKANGDYTQQVMFQGKRYTVSASTLEEYRQKARAIKLGDVPEDEELAVMVTLGQVIQNYLDRKREKLTPRTISNYEHVWKNVLDDPSECSVEVIDWQTLIDYLSESYSGGYVRVTWALIKAAMELAGYSVPVVDLPKANKRSNLLDNEQIKTLLDAARGHRCELPIILALHSLRRCEICALEVEDIHDGFIHVNKEYVRGEDGQFHIEHKTKTEKSTRKIPVFYDRLYDILPSAGRPVTYAPEYIRTRVKALCKACNLPECTLHDLRRSFASLAYSLGVPERRIMEYGGWSSPTIMYDVYVQLYAKDAANDAKPLMNYFKFTSDATETQASE